MVAAIAIYQPSIGSRSDYVEMAPLGSVVTIPWRGILKKPWTGKLSAPGSGKRKMLNRSNLVKKSGAITSIAEFETCVENAAKLQDVPTPILLGIIHTESGWNGARIRNINGSHDLGIMQVNGATWANRLAKDEFHSSSPIASQTVRYMLMHDDCYNINVGAWIFGLYYREADGNSLQAVGWYNSHDPLPMRQYQRRFLQGFRDLFGREMGKR